MDKFVIKGGAALQGEIPVGGSKNSALPALAAALLTEEPVTLRRVPAVRDIRTMQRLLVDIGSKVDVDGETVRLETPTIVCAEAPYELVKTMRASSLALGPLVARCGRARARPGGGAAGGAVRRGAGGAAGRLRHRGAAHQPAYFRVGTTGSAHQPGAWLYRGCGAGRAERSGGPLRPHHCHGHRRPDDGSRAGQGRKSVAQRAARAGGGDRK